MTDAELNRAVAERVMGWETKPANPKIGSPTSYVYRSSVGFHTTRFDWQPATRPDHTAMVMDKMLEDGWPFLELYISVRADPCAVFWRTGEPPQSRIAADTWTRAVCMAALKAREE